MSRKRNGVIWLCSKEEFIEKINTSISLKDALAKFGLGINGNNHLSIKERAKIENVDLSQIIENGKKRAKFVNRKPVNLEELLIIDDTRTISSHNLKLRLIKNKLIENKCIECGLSENWNNKPISLHLDHINGNRKDNRLENLRLLCPNCHSQTSTYAGKKKKMLKIKEVKLRKTKCPSYDILFDLTKEKSLTEIGKIYNVNGNAVKKWCKKLNIKYLDGRLK